MLPAYLWTLVTEEEILEGGGPLTLFVGFLGDHLFGPIQFGEPPVLEIKPELQFWLLCPSILNRVKQILFLLCSGNGTGVVNSSITLANVFLFHF